jgi:IS30 family transposase
MKQRKRIYYNAQQRAIIWEREEISRGLSSQLSIREIAKQLNHSLSTISREVNRNGGRNVYRPNKADIAAWGAGKCKQSVNRLV